MRPNEVSRIVIGAAMKVHTALGAGILESACDACLYYELTQANLQFEHQVHLPVVYQGIQSSLRPSALITSSKIAWSSKSSVSKKCYRSIERRCCPT